MSHRARSKVIHGLAVQHKLESSAVGSSSLHDHLEPLSARRPASGHASLPHDHHHGQEAKATAAGDGGQSGEGGAKPMHPILAEQGPLQGRERSLGQVKFVLEDNRLTISHHLLSVASFVSLADEMEELSEGVARGTLLEEEVEVHELLLANCYTQGGAIEALCKQVLPLLRGLRGLSITSCKLDKRDCRALGAYLTQDAPKYNLCLASLDLFDNPIGDDGVDCIADALLDVCGAVPLDSDPPRDGGGGEKKKKEFDFPLSFVRLKLSSTLMTDESLFGLVNAIHDVGGRCRLELLDLSGNDKITDASLRELAGLLKQKYCRITVVDVTGATCSMEARAAIYDSIERDEEERTLDLSELFISQAPNQEGGAADRASSDAARVAAMLHRSGGDQEDEDGVPAYEQYFVNMQAEEKMKGIVVEEKKHTHSS